MPNVSELFVGTPHGTISIDEGIAGEVGGGGGGGGNGGGGNDGGGGAITPPVIYRLQASNPFDCSELKWYNEGGAANTMT